MKSVFQVIMNILTQHVYPIVIILMLVTLINQLDNLSFTNELTQQIMLRALKPVTQDAE